MSLEQIAFLAQAQAQEEVGIEDVIGGVVALALVILAIAGLWKTLAKAGLPGWGAIVPFYNIYLLCKLARRPGWWVLLYLIPCVGIVVAFILSIDIARNFGKGTAFGIGLALLSFIFFPILGFGNARYLGKKADLDY
jgi:hypothetical protein